VTRKKLLISILVFLLYLVAVWFIAGFFLEDSTHLLVTFVLAVLGLTVLIVYLLIARLTAGQSQKAAAPPAQPSADAAGAPAATAAASPELTGRLQTMMNEANARLGQSQALAARGMKPTVTGLPLFLIGGPAGSGKTSTFLSAGLSPELVAGQVYREASVLPTGLCNLWYASDSIFAEAGGWFFGEDAASWRALLQHLHGSAKTSALGNLLKTQAPSNLRGFVLFCDVTPFLGLPDSNRIAGLVRRMQERLRMVGEVFGSHFPVYVVFSKADQLPYFADFFGRLVEAEDQQMLGATLPAALDRPAGEVYAETESGRLMKAFNDLYYNLAERRMMMLSREHVPAKRPGIYEFPREVKRVRDTIVQFLVELFRPNPLQPSPILRGFYFTGVRQVTAGSSLAPGSSMASVRGPGAGEATMMFNPQDLQKRAEARPAAQAHQEVLVPRWSFVSDLFHRVVLADRLGATARFTNKKSDLRRRIAWGALAGVSAILAFCFLRSWWNNNNLLDEVEVAAQMRYQPQAPGSLPTDNNLRAMEALRQQLATLTEYEKDGAPWRMRWGLYTGSRIYPRVRETYFLRFRQMFFQDAHANMATTLSRLSAQTDGSGVSYNTAYDTMRLYRMVTAGKCSPDVAFVSQSFPQAWLGTREMMQDRRDLAQAQISFYAKELADNNPYKVDEKADLISNGQSFLAAFGGVDRLFRGIIEEANKAPRNPARIVDYSPKYAEVLTGPAEVQAAFTKEGWDFVEKAIRDPNRIALGEPCVVGGRKAVTQLVQGPQVGIELTNLYVREYIRKWKEFSAGVGVQRYPSAEVAAKKLEVLADNRSPLLAAIFLISHHTNFPVSQSAASPATTPAATGLMNRLLPSSMKKAAKAAQQVAAAVDKATLSPSDIGRVFQPAREVVPPANSERLIDEPNRPYMNTVSDLQRAMQRLENDRPNNPNLALHAEARKAQEDGLRSVQLMSQKFNIAGAEGTDIEVKRLLEAPFRAAAGIIITDGGKVTRDKAAGAGKAFCAQLQKLERVFPFNPQSDTDAKADDLTMIFAPPAGAVFTLQQAFAKLVVKQGRFWVPAPEEQDAKLTPEFLQFFNRMMSISEALYGEGTTLRLRYGLRTLASPNIQNITLEIDGDTIAGAGQGKTFAWPGASGSQRVRARVLAGANVTFGSYDGMWGIFRWFGDADPRPPGTKVIQFSRVRQGRGNPEEVQDASGKAIVLRLELTELPNGIDVFDRNFFNIRCPGKVVE